MRIVTAPNDSRAVCITAAPSVTDEVFATAFPPAAQCDYIKLCYDGWLLTNIVRFRQLLFEQQQR